MNGILDRIQAAVTAGLTTYADVMRAVVAVQDQSDAHQRGTTLGQAVLAFDGVLASPEQQVALWGLQRAARQPGPPPGTTSVRAMLGMQLADLAALYRANAAQPATPTDDDSEDAT